MRKVRTTHKHSGHRPSDKRNSKKLNLSPHPVNKHSKPWELCSIVIFVLGVLILLLRLLQLLFPAEIDLLGGRVREHDVKDLAVPIDGVAFDALFDILQSQ